MEVEKAQTGASIGATQFMAQSSMSPPPPSSGGSPRSSLQQLAGEWQPSEQEQPIDVAPVAEDQFEFEFHPQGWGGPNTVSLALFRDDAGLITGFGLSSDAERNIIFEKH